MWSLPHFSRNEIWISFIFFLRPCPTVLHISQSNHISLYALPWNPTLSLSFYLSSPLSLSILLSPPLSLYLSPSLSPLSLPLFLSLSLPSLSLSPLSLSLSISLFLFLSPSPLAFSFYLSPSLFLSLSLPLSLSRSHFLFLSLFSSIYHKLQSKNSRTIMKWPLDKSAILLWEFLWRYYHKYYQMRYLLTAYKWLDPLQPEMACDIPDWQQHFISFQKYVKTKQAHSF